jgi:kinesin family member 11
VFLLTNNLQTANDHSNSIQGTTRSVYAETMKVVDGQMEDLDEQMTDLDDFVTRAKSQNSKQYQQHGSTLSKLSGTVEQSFANISSHSGDTYGRVKNFGADMGSAVQGLSTTLEPLDDYICQPLSNLREEISHTALQEYQPTGETPEKIQYSYPTNLPRTDTHETLLANMRGAAQTQTPSKSTPNKSLIPQPVFSDGDISERAKSPLRPPASLERQPLSITQRDPNLTANGSLNLTTGSLLFDPAASTMTLPPSLGVDVVGENTVPLFKRSVPVSGSSGRVQLGMHLGKSTRRGNVQHHMHAGEGRENVPPVQSVFAQSLPRRKSPRLVH